MTAANACPELMPKTATATAMASSKLFDAAVKERVADLSLDKHMLQEVDLLSKKL